MHDASSKSFRMHARLHGCINRHKCNRWCPSSAPYLLYLMYCHLMLLPTGQQTASEPILQEQEQGTTEHQAMGSLKYSSAYAGKPQNSVALTGRVGKGGVSLLSRAGKAKVEFTLGVSQGAAGRDPWVW